MLCTLATLLLGCQASKVTLNASFEKTIPTGHPYMVNYSKYKSDLAGQGNALRVAVENRTGDIYSKPCLDALRKISDALSMLFWVYSAVVLLCLVTFRSWRAVIRAVLPLMLTSILCEALMALLGIGIKVATLPVIALGVGIGVDVDYALYIMVIVVAQLRAGQELSQACCRALLFTGRIVMLTSATLAIGVATRVFSPIKVQADMGLLLAFMFVWNMLGALILLPALAYFLFPAAREQRRRGANPKRVPGWVTGAN